MHLGQSTANRNGGAPRNAQNDHRNGRGNIVSDTTRHNVTVGNNGALNRNADRNAIRDRTTRAVHNALTARPVRDALRHPANLRDPHTRALVTSAAATAAWHGQHEHEWWRHRHGGFGWVGPIFWPLAYYDVYNYALWGDSYDDSFWDYGYSDLYAGLFAPYDYEELVSYLPDYSGGASSRPSSGGATRRASREIRGGATNGANVEIAQLCGDDTRNNIAGLPIDQVERTIQPDEKQRAALDELAQASAKAGQIIKAACPTDVALTAPRRIEAMERRVEALIQAVEIVQDPLDQFYASLSDEQKARLNALAQAQDRGTSKTSAKETALSPDCSAQQTVPMDWPTADIVQAVHPNEAQRAKLNALQDAFGKAADMLQVACPKQPLLTPPARLAAVDKRLYAMLDAIKTVRTALNDFYASLSDEQKAQFDAIGPRTARG